jgi:hypothetical protein
MEKKIGHIVGNSGLFFSLLIILLFIFTRIASFNGLYGQDAHEYFRYTKALHEFIVGGKNPGDYFWPLFYPLCGALFSLIVPALFSLQLISIISFILIFYFLEKIIITIFEAEKLAVRIFLFLFLFLSPFMLRGAIVVMSDVFCAMWITVSFYVFTRYYFSFAPRYFLIFAITTTAAVMTRYAALVVLVVPSLAFCFLFLKHFNLKYFLLAFIAILFLMIPHFLIRSSDPFMFMKQGQLNGWSIRNFFLSTFFTSEGHATYPLPNALYGFYNWFHPGYCFYGIIAIFFFRKKNFQAGIVRILLASILAYSFFIVGIPYQNLRFMVVTFPLVSIIFFPAVMSLWEFISSRFASQTIVILMYVLIQAALFTRAFLPFYRYNVFEKKAAEEINKLPGFAVYTFGMEGALHSYDVRNKIIGLGSGKSDTVISTALLLFNAKQLSEQWAGTLVMSNYEAIIQNKKIKRIKLFNNGWELSEIE